MCGWSMGVHAWLTCLGQRQMCYRCSCGSYKKGLFAFQLFCNFLLKTLNILQRDLYLLFYSNSKTTLTIKRRRIWRMSCLWVCRFIYTNRLLEYVFCWNSCLFAWTTEKSFKYVKCLAIERIIYYQICIFLVWNIFRCQWNNSVDKHTLTLSCFLGLLSSPLCIYWHFLYILYLLTRMS